MFRHGFSRTGRRGYVHTRNRSCHRIQGAPLSILQFAEGRSEEIVGKALKDKRDEVVLCTKVLNSLGTGPNRSGLSRLNVMRAVEAALDRLQTDHIDLYLLHSFDPHTPLEETLRALDDLVLQGKVRYIGCSNFRAWKVMEALWTSDAHNLHSFVCIQDQYN